MKHPDQQYIDGLFNNDRSLLNELYRKFSGKIKWMVLQNNGTEADAADIFQDGLLYIYNKARKQDFVLTCPFEAYLYLICKTKWINELKKRGSGPSTLTEEYVNKVPDVSDEDAEVVEKGVMRHTLLKEKLAEMSDSCKELLHLSWNGKSMEEVAQILQMTYGYARKKKSNCMEKLIKLIKQSPGFDSLKW